MLGRLMGGMDSSWIFPERTAKGKSKVMKWVTNAKRMSWNAPQRRATLNTHTNTSWEDKSSVLRNAVLYFTSQGGLWTFSSGAMKQRKARWPDLNDETWTYRQSLKLWTSFRIACYYQNASYRKNGIKVVDKLPICKAGFVHSWHRIHPKKPRILQEMVQSFHEVQS
jgi:hypothetical protein